MKKFCAILFSFVLVLMLALPVAAGDAAGESDSLFDTAPALTAPAGYVVNLDTNIVVYEKNSETPLSAASLTKMMTTLLLLENYQDQLDSISLTAPSYIYDLIWEQSTNASTADIRRGETQSLRNLLYAMLLPSGNEAAYIVADYMGGGSIDNFVAMMNDEAKAVGCTGTTFVDPCGLNPNNITTARDAYLILRADIRPQHITALGMEAAAALIIIDPLHTTLDPVGITLVLLSAATFALYAVLGKKQCAQYSGVAVTCFSCLAASAEMIVLLLISHIPAVADALQAAGLPMFAAMPFFSGYTTGNLLNVLYICVFVTAGGYACYFMGMEATSAMQGSLVFFFKPVLAPILAMLILGEEIPWNMWAGIGLMLVASEVSMIPTWETLLSVRPFIIDRILHRQH